VVYWCNSYTIVHFSLDIIEWFKYKLEKVFKIVLDTDSPPSQYQQKQHLLSLLQYAYAGEKVLRLQ
jgi:hypothetical protein